MCCTSQTLLLWTRNQRRWVRAGEVRDPGESEWEAKRWKTKYVMYSSNITKWMSESMERITRDTWDCDEDWHDVRHGRLIITPDGTTKVQQQLCNQRKHLSHDVETNNKGKYIYILRLHAGKPFSSNNTLSRGVQL